jgi:hypothetical protein
MEYCAGSELRPRSGLWLLSRNNANNADIAPAAAHGRQPKGAGVGRPLTGRARCLSDVACGLTAICGCVRRSWILARRKDVPSLQTYSDHSIDKHARLRERSGSCRTGTRSLPAQGPVATWQLPDRNKVECVRSAPITFHFSLRFTALLTGYISAAPRAIGHQATHRLRCR